MTAGLFSFIKKEIFRIIYIDCTIIFLLLMPQLVWIQDNRYNTYLTVFDKLPFRLAITLAVGIIIGYFYILIVYSFIKKQKEPEQRKSLKKLVIAHLPFVLLIILPFRIEIGILNLVNSIILYGSIIVYYVLMEIFFLSVILKENFYKKMVSALPVIIFFILTLFVFAPVQMYLSNPAEFYFSFNVLLLYLAVLSLATMIILYRFIFFFRYESKVYKFVVTFIFALGIVFFIQGNFLVWHYGLFDGTKIEWDKKWLNGLIDGIVWISALVTASVFSGKIYNLIKAKGRQVCLALVLFQLFSNLFTAYQQQPVLNSMKDSSFRNYTIDEKNKFNYSKETNVIILVADEFQTDVFWKIINEKPEYRDILDGFTYYPDTTAASTHTTLAVPAILTGEYYDNSVSKSRFIEQSYLSNSILKTLKENGYAVDVYPLDMETIAYSDKIISNIKQRGDICLASRELAYVFDSVFFRYLPHYLKKIIYQNNRKPLRLFVERLEESKVRYARAVPFKFKREDMEESDNIRFIYGFWTESRTNMKKCFKFYHIAGVHADLNIDESFYVRNREYNRETYLNQAKAVMKIIGWFIDGLKNIGIYDNSLILIMGDHGSARTKDLYINENFLNRGFQEKPGRDRILTNIAHNNLGRALPLLLIKPFLSRGGLKVSNTESSLLDIPITIADELQIKSDFKGFNLMNGIISNRTRVYMDYAWNELIGSDFLSNEQVLIINGPSWLNSSWSNAGKILDKQKRFNLQDMLYRHR